MFAGWSVFKSLLDLESKYSCDFSLKKTMKKNCAYLLEFMLTFDIIQNTSPLMYTKLEI